MRSTDCVLQLYNRQETPGKIKITVNSDGLKGKTVEINSVKGSAIPVLD